MTHFEIIFTYINKQSEDALRCHKKLCLSACLNFKCYYIKFSLNCCEHKMFVCLNN